MIFGSRKLTKVKDKDCFSWGSFFFPFFFSFIFLRLFWFAFLLSFLLGNTTKHHSFLFNNKYLTLNIMTIKDLENILDKSLLQIKSDLIDIRSDLNCIMKTLDIIVK